MKHSPNNSNSNASKAQLINSVTNQPTSNSKKGYRGRRYGKRTNCRFCKSADHTTTNCTKYTTPESRIAALRSRLAVMFALSVLKSIQVHVGKDFGGVVHTTNLA